MQRATDAKIRTGEAQIKEEIGLAWNGVQTEGMVNGWTLEQKASALQTELKKEDGSSTATASGNDVNVKNYKGYDVVINSTNGSFTSFAKAGTDGGGNIEDKDTPKFELTIAGNGESTTPPPNPDSSVFEHVDGTTIENGYVIRDKNNGNEFVWVPVEKGQKISLDVVTEEDITAIKLTDPAGAEINLGITGTIGKSYKNENIIPTYNGVYKAEVTTASGTTPKTLLVRSLYAADTFNDYYTDEKIEGEIFDFWNSKVGSPGDVATVCKRLGLGDNKEMIDFKAWILGIGYTDLEDYKTSVNNNGGFYVGRYEAGNDSGTLVSKSGIDPYVNVTRSQAKTLADGMSYSGSHLLTNAAWDRTLGWIINKNDKSLTLQDIVVDSKTWGNYSDSKVMKSDGTTVLKESGTRIKSNTGETTYTKVNNIYDLAGNVIEWTSAQSPNTSLPCVCRGGNYYDAGSNSPAYFRYRSIEGITYGDPEEYQDISTGFRVALFL